MENLTNKEEKKITLQELKDILNVMNFYNRNRGFMGYDLVGTLRFFDGEPSDGGIYITKEDIKEFINDYKTI
jgi:hypothetical protein